MNLHTIETPFCINGHHTWIDIFYYITDEPHIVSIMIDGEKQDIDSWKETTLGQAYEAIARHLKRQNDEDRARSRYEAVCLESGSTLRFIHN